MLYGKTAVMSEQDDLRGVDIKPFVELAIVDDISHMDSNAIKEFCESEQAKVLVERSVLNKGTMMRLSKADDEKRRIKLNAYKLAKDANDPNWKKMVMYRKKWKEYRDKVLAKYARKATAVSKVAQKEYIQTARKQSQSEFDAQKKEA